jgi:hypothetical protein
MSAVHQSRTRRLSYLAVLVWLWAVTLAQAHVKTASIAQTRLTETPLLSLRLERENPCWQGVSLEAEAHLTLESRIGIFAGGDPINGFDANGLCVRSIRSSDSFAIAQEGVWGAEEGFDATANFLN